MSNYLPVEPIIDSNGQLMSVLALYPNAKNAKPVPLDPGQETFSTPALETSILSYSVSASLKYSGFVSNTFDLDSKIFVVDVVCYSESNSPGESDNVVLYTRWGCGLRVFYSITNTHLRHFEGIFLKNCVLTHYIV
jgi:hypothetical protein